MFENTDRKIVVCGFPGVGKTTAADNKVMIDLESSDYHWIMTPKGKVQHPEWPMNYVNLISMLVNEVDGLDDYKDLKYIFTSTHKEVIKGLMDRKIPFVIIAPKNKLRYIRRYQDRGSSEQFIKSIRDNWDTYMKDISSYGAPVIYTDVFIGDILKMSSAEAYLTAKIEDMKKYIYGFDVIDEIDVEEES